jgi:hypothetical protein
MVVSLSAPRTAKIKGSKRAQKEIEADNACSSLQNIKGHKAVQNMWYVRGALLNIMLAKLKCVS